MREEDKKERNPKQNVFLLPGYYIFHAIFIEKYNFQAARKYFAVDPLFSIYCACLIVV